MAIIPYPACAQIHALYNMHVDHFYSVSAAIIIIIIIIIINNQSSLLISW